MSATKSTTPRPSLDDGGDRDLQSPVNPPPPIFDSLPEDMVHSQQEQELFTEAIRSRPAHRVSIQQVYSDSDEGEDGVPATQNVRSTRSLSRSRSASPSRTDDLGEPVDPTKASPDLSSLSEGEESDDEGVSQASGDNGTLVDTSQAVTTEHAEVDIDAIRKVWVGEAMRISIPDLLKWIAAKSSFIVGVTPSEGKQIRPMLSASALLPELDTPDPFIGLSTSQGLIAGIDMNTDKFANHRPTSLRNLVGKYAPPRDFFSTSINTFKLCDSLINSDVLRATPEGIDFLTPIKSNYLSVAREGDIIKFEENARKSLVVLSNLDATLAALINAYPKQKQPDSFFMKGLFRCTQSLQALADLASFSLHQAVTHRRDTALNSKLNHQKHPVAISEEHLALLRNGPYLDRTELFEPDLIKRIQTERNSLRSEELHSAALNRLAYTQPQKRSHTAASASVSVPPERQPKKRKGHSQGQRQQPKLETQSPSVAAGQGSSNR